MIEPETIQDPVKRALAFASYAEGTHHDLWVVDQMVRALTNCPLVEMSALDYQNKPYTFLGQGESDEYKKWVSDFEAGEDGSHTYSWDTGQAP
jgi:hypothetical protein